jgi:hypothetical protein
MIYQQHSQKYSNIKKIKNYQSHHSKLDEKHRNYINYILITTHNFQSLIYNIFIVGLAFNSTISIVGIVLNPSSIISVSGLFYILGIFIFTAVLIDAIRSFYSSRQQCNKLRVVFKVMFLGIMFISPIPLFAGMVVIDILMMIYEYGMKQKQWVIPKLWLLIQSCSLLGYGILIFLNNMKIGIIIASICILMLILCDIYLHYKEYEQL